MKERLAAEGLFDADYKREIPENIGLEQVTSPSPTGAAVRDIIQIAKRRDLRVKHPPSRHWCREKRLRRIS